MKKQYVALGGTVGKPVLWNPTRRTSTPRPASSSQRPGRLVIITPGHVQKFAAVSRADGKWDPKKTFMTEALRNGDVLKAIGSPVVGCAALLRARPAALREAFAALWKAQVHGAKPYTGFEGTAFDASMVAFLAAGKSCSASDARLKANLIPVSGPPGIKVTFRNLTTGVKALLAGKDIDYEGAFSPVDFDKNGDISSAVYEIWQNDGNGKISTLRTITFRG